MCSILTDNLVVGKVAEEVTGALMHTSVIYLRPVKLPNMYIHIHCSKTANVATIPGPQKPTLLATHHSDRYQSDTTTLTYSMYRETKARHTVSTIKLRTWKTSITRNSRLFLTTASHYMPTAYLLHTYSHYMHTSANRNTTIRKGSRAYPPPAMK